MAETDGLAVRGRFAAARGFSDLPFVARVDAEMR